MSLDARRQERPLLLQFRVRLSGVHGVSLGPPSGLLDVSSLPGLIRTEESNPRAKPSLRSSEGMRSFCIKTDATGGKPSSF